MQTGWQSSGKNVQSVITGYTNPIEKEDIWISWYG